MPLPTDDRADSRPRRTPRTGACRPAPLALPLLAALCLAGCATSPRDLRPALSGKTVVITGASSGIGRGVAQAMAANGANVVLAARRGGLLQQVAREAGGQTLVVPTDVARPEEMRRLAEAAVQKYGRIDVWINDAGVGAVGAFERIPLDDHLRVIDVNLKGVVTGSWLALQQFRRQGSGVLINIGSVAGRMPFPYYASYAATKHAIVGLGTSLHQELRLAAARDIHVVTVNPYATDTPWFEHAANYSGRAPRMVLMDGPQKVVAAVVQAAVHPRPEVNVGFKANAAAASERVARSLTHRAIGAIVRRVMEAAPPAAATTGSLYEPMAEGRGIDGGVRARMAAEKRADEGMRTAEAAPPDAAVRR